ncbi:10263_t:CDS:1 [Cetraspora pellucida]|uniref:10263_t:CDS:1 n=1 Tax=Cetraspora pellucida TaxID=1433469 RepID=A0A9N9D3X8_9GLOM|nr:10263_t:CDS:1 [Cetraspora pellucida]
MKSIKIKSKDLVEKTKSSKKKANPIIITVNVKHPPDLDVDYFVLKKKTRPQKFSNAFVFYRTAYNQTLRSKGIKLSQSDVSASASLVWSGLSAKIKNFYFDFASDVRKRYMSKYPVSYYRCEYKSESKSMITSKDEPKKLKKYNFVYENENPKIVKNISFQKTQLQKEVPSQLDIAINPPDPSNSSNSSNPPANVNENILTGQPSLFNENHALWTSYQNLFCRDETFQLVTMNSNHSFPYNERFNDSFEYENQQLLNTFDFDAHYIDNYIDNYMHFE